jgi:hypothetical protein
MPVMPFLLQVAVHERRSPSMSVGRRHSGSLPQLPSGHYQVRYAGPDGRQRTAPQTFPSRTLARRWLSLTEADMVRGQWRDPSARTEALRVYAVRVGGRARRS